MGNYISQSDIEDRYGVDNVAAWSNLDQDDSQTNAARVTSAIAYAEQYIDDRLRGSRYSLPLTGNSANALNTIKTIAATVAGQWLYESRGMTKDAVIAEKMLINEDRIEKQLNGYLSGAMKLDAALAGSGPSAPVVVGDLSIGSNFTGSGVW